VTVEPLAEIGFEHVPHPRGQARILVVGREGNEQACAVSRRVADS
jgi:hypothetical protein